MHFLKWNPWVCRLGLIRIVTLMELENMRLVLVGVLIAQVFAFTGCAVTPPPKVAWNYYDECETSTHSFTDMVTCGKQRRNAYCQARSSCSDIGNSVVQYADSLAEAVSKHEMTESEAKMRFIEFKTKQAQAARQTQLQAAAIAAATAPTTCSRLGNSITCY